MHTAGTGRIEEQHLEILTGYGTKIEKTSEKLNWNIKADTDTFSSGIHRGSLTIQCQPLYCHAIMGNLNFSTKVQITTLKEAFLIFLW